MMNNSFPLSSQRRSFSLPHYFPFYFQHLQQKLSVFKSWIILPHRRLPSFFVRINNVTLINLCILYFGTALILSRKCVHLCGYQLKVSHYLTWMLFYGWNWLEVLGMVEIEANYLDESLCNLKYRAYGITQQHAFWKDDQL